MSKIAIVDVETSGLDPQIHEILEIGAVVIDSVTMEVLDSFGEKVLPLKISVAQPKALEVNAYNEKDWEESFLLPHVLQLFSEKVKGAIFMSYGVSFDRAFLEAAYKSCKLPYPFHYRHLDLMTLAWHASKEGEPLSLSAVADRLGVPPEAKPHRALAGAQCAASVYSALTNPTEEQIKV